MARRSGLGKGLGALIPTELPGQPSSASIREGFRQAPKDDLSYPKMRGVPKTRIIFLSLSFPHWLAQFSVGTWFPRTFGIQDVLRRPSAFYFFRLPHSFLFHHECLGRFSQGEIYFVFRPRSGLPHMDYPLRCLPIPRVVSFQSFPEACCCRLAVTLWR